MAACGYDRINIMSLACYQDEYVAHNALYALIKAMYPGRLYAFGSLYYPPGGFSGGRADFADQARRWIDAGMDGMKMEEGKPTTRRRTGIALDSPLYDEYYRYLERNSIPLQYHVGDPATFWDAESVPTWARENGWFYGGADFIGREALLAEVEGFLEKFPALNVTFSHFYFLSDDMDRAASFLDRWPCARFDITPGSEMYFNFSRDPSAWRDFFIRYQGRILYGTDSEVDDQAGWANTASVIRRFLETDHEFEGFGGRMRGLCLPADVLRRIYHDNFLAFAGDTPKKVDACRAAQETRRLLSTVPDAPFRNEVIAQLQIIEGKLTQISL
jgi:predicted TIM-barrel fold metal-dependent hydrolase